MVETTDGLRLAQAKLGKIDREFVIRLTKAPLNSRRNVSFYVRDTYLFICIFTFLSLTSASSALFSDDFVKLLAGAKFYEILINNKRECSSNYVYNIYASDYSVYLAKLK
ncbi:hypothetical protein LX36DRAFT_676397 [Colletotrichum falcatum]|nr:hypothetical protein LX36DRAFT_676397 [Colletotrichum falcatum]